MARKRASMREGPLAELFRATEAAQRGGDAEPGAESPAVDDTQLIPVSREEAALEATVEHVYDFDDAETVVVAPAAAPEPVAEAEPEPEAVAEEPEAVEEEPTSDEPDEAQED